MTDPHEVKQIQPTPPNNTKPPHSLEEGPSGHTAPGNPPRHFPQHQVKKGNPFNRRGDPLDMISDPPEFGDLDWWLPSSMV